MTEKYCTIVLRSRRRWLYSARVVFPTPFCDATTVQWISLLDFHDPMHSKSDRRTLYSHPLPLSPFSILKYYITTINCGTRLLLFLDFLDFFGIIAMILKEGMSGKSKFLCSGAKAIRFCKGKVKSRHWCQILDFLYLLLLVHRKKGWFLGEFFKIRILMDWHFPRFPVSENRIFSGWSMCVSVISITHKQIIAEVQIWYYRSSPDAGSTWNFLWRKDKYSVYSGTH